MSKYEVLSKPELVGVIFEPNAISVNDNKFFIDGKFYLNNELIENNVYVIFLDYVLPNYEESKAPFSCRVSMSMVIQIDNKDFKDVVLNHEAPKEIYIVMKKFFEYLTGISFCGTIIFPELKL